MHLPETTGGSVARAALTTLAERLETVDAVAIGPGLGRDEETQAFVRSFVKVCPVPMVIDADALNAFAGRAGELAERGSDAILTPHTGEFARLSGAKAAQIEADRIAHVEDLARVTGAVVLLKGSRTVIAAPGVGGSGTGRARCASAPRARRCSRQPAPETCSPAPSPRSSRGDWNRFRPRRRARSCTALPAGWPERWRARARPRKTCVSCFPKRAPMFSTCARTSRARVSGAGRMTRYRPTVARIDLDAVRHNVRTLRPPGSELMAIVKANAYGHGDVEVARAALEAGADVARCRARGGGHPSARRGDRRADPRALRVPPRRRTRRPRSAPHSHPLHPRGAPLAGEDRGGSWSARRRAREGRHRDASHRGVPALRRRGVRRRRRRRGVRGRGVLDPSGPCRGRRGGDPGPARRLRGGIGLARRPPASAACREQRRHDPVSREPLRSRAPGHRALRLAPGSRPRRRAGSSPCVVVALAGDDGQAPAGR